MKSKKILLIIFMAVMLIACSVNFVYADSYSVTMGTDKTNYAEEQVVEITVSLSNVNSNAGLYGLNGKLDYDTDVFEQISSNATTGATEDITALNGWGSVTYNGADGVFSTVTTSPLTTGTQQIMKIKLKVKKGAPLGKATVMLSNLEASNGDDDITTTPASISVNIKDPSEIGGEIPPAGETPDPEPTEEPTTTPSPATSKPISTPSSSAQLPQGGSNNGKLPQTGLTDYAAPVIIGALVISLIAFIAYRRYKDI